MHPTDSTLTNCHQLLQSVLLNAFKVSTMLFTPPYEDITKIDYGMRAAVWTDYYDNDDKINLSGIAQSYRFIIIKSNLGFYNIMAIVGFGEMPSFISVGPFRDEDLSPNYFTQILKESHISPTDIQRMKSIYEKMPLVQVDAVANVTKNIIANFIPEFKELTPELMQYSKHTRAVNINSDLLDNFSIEYAEKYRELLFEFIHFLKMGDSTNARKSLNHFLDTFNMISNKSMRDYKMILQVINNYCHLTFLQTAIHPLHILKLSETTRMKIENTVSLAKLEQLSYEICHKYCLLVRNYANPESSRLTKDVISYIQLHLEEELSLRRLAAHFHRNASVLSNTFSKETGQTLTQFIHQTRIQEAIRLFNTTNMSVSEVAMAVGYPDFSYFSKVFSKNVGYSPRDYRQQNFPDLS